MIRVRATILASGPSPDDRREVERIIEQASDVQLTSSQARADGYAGLSRKVNQLYRRTIPPALVSELAITGSRLLAESEIRGVAAAFLRHDDTRVHRDRERPRPVASGEVAIIRNPPGLAQALALGIPLYGRIGERSLTDLVAIDHAPGRSGR